MSIGRTDGISLVNLPSPFKTSLISITNDLRPNGMLLDEKEIEVLKTKISPLLSEIQPDSGIKLSKRHKLLSQTALAGRFSLAITKDKAGKVNYWVRVGSDKNKKLLGKGGVKKTKMVQNVDTGEWKRIASTEQEEEIFDEFEYLKLLGRGVFPVIEDQSKSSKDKFFLISDYIPGENLATVIDDHYNGTKKLSVAELQHIMVQVLECIDDLHEKGMLHNDVKPTNFILDPMGKVHVIDFDTSLLLIDAVVTFIQTTDSYRAPELKLDSDGKCHLTKQTDIFSCGLVLDEILGGLLIKNNSFYWSNYPKLEMRQKPEMRPWLDAIEQMKKANPKERPQLKDVIAKLRPLCLPLPKKPMKCLPLEKIIPLLSTPQSLNDLYNKEYPLWKPYYDHEVVMVNTNQVATTKDIIRLISILDFLNIQVASQMIIAPSFESAEEFLKKEPACSTAIVFKSMSLKADVDVPPKEIKFEQKPQKMDVKLEIINAVPKPSARVCSRLC